MKKMYSNSILKNELEHIVINLSKNNKGRED